MHTQRKTIFTLSVLFIAFLSISPLTAFSQSKDEKKILARIRLEEKLWNAGDVEGYVNLYAPLDSTRMILGKGAAYGKDSILAFYKRYWPRERMGKLVLDGEQMERLSKKFYYVTGYFHVTLPDGKKVNGRYSSLMIKIKGEWYLYTDHSG
ncbi:MAG TPA: nuclear transport factor 2 family protein [Chitinophagaceae bacterium]|jgi:ketosteroid isomerase-like protein|nr:nuclear transport factor 2 family protein [Chitinophagaceae bacterium]